MSKSESMASVRDKKTCHAAARISMVSIGCNVLLALMKTAAGFASHSGALLSDALHSAADVLSSGVVILGVCMAAKESDAEHPYGHERFECVTAMILAFILCATGLYIGTDAIFRMVRGNVSAEKIGSWALGIAAASVAIKECMFRYVWMHAERIDSSALRAEAWHHRSDALCSLGVLIGIAGARMGVQRLDAVASLMVCGVVVHASCGIFQNAVRKLVDHACSAEMELQIREVILSASGVVGLDEMRTRECGSRIDVDAVLVVCAKTPLEEGEAIAQNVLRMLKERFPEIKHVMLRIKPEENAEIRSSISLDNRVESD